MHAHEHSATSMHNTLYIERQEGDLSLPAVFHKGKPKQHAHAGARLLVAMHEIHEAVVVVVVVRALGRVGRQHQVVGPQAVALRVRVREDARLQQLVVRVANACAYAGLI